MTNKNNKTPFKSSKIFIFLIALLIPMTLLTCCRSSEKAAGSVTTAPEHADDQAGETDSKYSNVNFTDAVNAYYEGELEESISMFKSLLNKDTDNRSVYLSLSRLLTENGNHIEAYKYLTLFNHGNMKKNIFGKSENSTASPLPGSLWEYPELSLFLSGDNERYLNEVKLAENSKVIKKTVQDISENENTGISADEETRKMILTEKQFFSAWAYYDSGNEEKAVELLESAVNKRAYFPSANLFLGNIYYKINEFEAAEKNLNRALKLDSNQTWGRVTIAKTLLEQGRLYEGYAALERALAIRPWDTETALLKEEVETDYPDILRKDKAAEKAKRTASRAPDAAVFTEHPELMPSVRVGLAEKIDELYLKPGGDYTLTGSNGRVLHKGSEDRILKITSGNNTLDFFSENDEKILTAYKPVSISCSSPESTILIFNVRYSSGYLSAGKEDRSYRGRISLVPQQIKGITVINTLPLEEYLYSVVPSEIPAYWPAEALRAQAIAARSYTLANMGRFRKKGYDVSGSIKSAFYRGFTGEDKRTTDAVEITRGLVLKAEGKYLNALYSANSAGRTESAENVWGWKTPLIGVSDPHFSFKYDPPSPDELARWILSEPESYSSNPEYAYRSSYRWRLIVPADEIAKRNGNDIGEIISITTRGRGNSGRVEKVLIKGTGGEKVIKGDKVRRALGGLRSSLFIIMPKLSKDGKPEYFIFAGAGWGHGVGMCQTGSAGMAHEGFTADEILKHYYPLAELTSIY